MSVFDKVTRSKLNTGSKKLSKTPKPLGTSKEDTQGFRISTEKNVPHNEGFKSPVTKVPMNEVESNTDLGGATIMLIIFPDFLMVEHIFLSS